MFFEGLGLQDLLKFEDFRSKYALQNHSRSQVFILLDFVHFWSTFAHILGSFLRPFGVLGGLWATFGRLWASFGFNLGALGAAWSPWAPILVSEIDFGLIFGRFGPPNPPRCLQRQAC